MEEIKLNYKDKIIVSLIVTMFIVAIICSICSVVFQHTKQKEFVVTKTYEHTYIDAIVEGEDCYYICFQTPTEINKYIKIEKENLLKTTRNSVIEEGYYRMKETNFFNKFVNFILEVDTKVITRYSMSEEDIRYIYKEVKEDEWRRFARGKKSCRTVL